MTNEKLKEIEDRIIPTKDVLDLIREVKRCHIIMENMTNQINILKGI